MTRTKITVKLSDFIKWYFGENEISSINDLTYLISLTDFLWDNKENKLIPSDIAAKILFEKLEEECTFFYEETPWDYDIIFEINGIEYYCTSSDEPMSEDE